MYTSHNSLILVYYHLSTYSTKCFVYIWRLKKNIWCLHIWYLWLKRSTPANQFPERWQEKIVKFVPEEFFHLKYISHWRTFILPLIFIDFSAAFIVFHDKNCMKKIRMDPFLVLKNVTGLMGHRAFLCVGLKSSQNMLHAFISSSLITPISIYTDTTLTLLWYVIINSSSTTSSSSSLSLDNNKIFPLTKLYESTNKRWKKSFLKNKILFYEFLLHD